MMKLQTWMILLPCIFLSCTRPLEDFALTWTQEVKENILADSQIESDRMQVDSTHNNWHVITYWNADRKLKALAYRPMDGDTVTSIHFSKGQEFELIRELCPGVDRQLEVIRYDGKHVGFTELRYCNGKLKAAGFRYGEDIGTWKEYDQAGRLLKTRQLGNSGLLKQLKMIEYK